MHIERNLLDAASSVVKYPLLCDGRERTSAGQIVTRAPAVPITVTESRPDHDEVNMDAILKKIEKLAVTHDRVSPEIIAEKNIKLGLRNQDGSGVIVGITSKGEVLGYRRTPLPGGKGFSVDPVPGKLYYCGYDVEELVTRIHAEKRFGFDEITYLLLTGALPATPDLDRFTRVLAKRRTLSKIERRIFLDELANDNQMYALHSVISHLSLTDKNPDSTDIKDVSVQCINLIAKTPTIVAYNYNAMRFRKGGNLTIVHPDPRLSTAENFLYMLKGERPSEFEAYLFDLCLMLHAEHGGGNNSTFTVRTVSSSGANTYMAICAGIASLSGHLHGGANEAVMMMMADVKRNVKHWDDDEEIAAYLAKILAGKAHDRSGKIYGMGHAVYTTSDPRAVILREKAEQYAAIHGVEDEFRLFSKVADIGARLLQKDKGKVVAPNVDFYSGFVYKHMGIPIELFTPIFAMARIVGWSAHRIEQIIQAKLIRPAYLSSLGEKPNYLPLDER